MDEGIIARDLLIDGDQDLFFPDQLQQMAQLDALPLDQLPYGYGRREFAGEIAFAVSRLELSHERDRHHRPTEFAPPTALTRDSLISIMSDHANAECSKSGNAGLTICALRVGTLHSQP